MAGGGKGLSLAGHHHVRLPGEERHPAAAGDGRRSGGLRGGEDGGRGTNFRAVYVVMKFEYSLTFPLTISLLTILLP